MYYVYNLLTIKLKVPNNIHYKLRFSLVLFLTSNGYGSGLVIKSSLTCDPMGYSLPGSSVHGIFQARTLEWLAVSFSRGSSRPRDRNQVSCIAGRFFTSEPPGKTLLMSKVLMILLLISLSIKQGFKYGQSLIFSFYYRKSYAFLLKHCGHLSALQKLNRADYSYCSI